MCIQSWSVHECLLGVNMEVVRGHYVLDLVVFRIWIDNNECITFSILTEQFYLSVFMNPSRAHNLDHIEVLLMIRTQEWFVQAHYPNFGTARYA